MQHYIYAYLDPRKPSFYDIDGVRVPCEPFYVGVSKSQRRKEDHLREARKYLRTNEQPKRNKRKVYKIASILQSDMTPIIAVIKSNLSEDDAYSLERNIIKNVGRVCDGGPLLNVLKGGQIINSELISISNSGKPSHKRKEVIQLTTDGAVVKRWPSVAEAKANTNISHIAACCRGDRNTAGGFRWEYADKIVTRRSKYKKRKTNKVRNRKIVEQYTMDGVQVGEYSSITEAAEKNEISRKNISNMLIGKSKSAGGYLWKYKDQ